MRRRSGAAVASALLLLAACKDEPRTAAPAPERPVEVDAAPRPPANLRHVDLKVLGMT
jgi:hypothetical protein